MEQGASLAATHRSLEQTDMLARLAEYAICSALALPLILAELPNVVRFSR